MNSSLKEKFLQLQKENVDQSQKVAARQAELDSLLKTKAHMGDQVYISPGRTDAVQLEIKLWELEKRREALKIELQVCSSPEEQKSGLLTRLKNDNVQLATLKKTINEIQEQIKHAEQSLSHTHQVTDEEQGVRQAKYMELKKRDETIEEFLSTVENQKENENSKLRSLEAEILQLLKKLAAKVAVVPTAADYKNINQNQPAKSEILNTMKSIGNEHQNLSRHLNKVEVMTNKVETELKSLTNSIDTMRRQLALFSNTADLESSIEEKRIMLTKVKAELESTKEDTKSKLRDITVEFNEVQRLLVENEQHAQISYIEKKLNSVDQSNAIIKEYLEDAKSGEDLEICRSKALNSVLKLNVLIRNCVK